VEVAEDFDTDLVKNDQELVVVVHMASIKVPSKHRSLIKSPSPQVETSSVKWN
jgi:hypothetical protein